MLDVMYDLPSSSEVKSFTITQELVEQRSKAKVLAIPSSKTDRAQRESA
jgi:ATP-dependent Clp protease ATP-binding subunit ClpX